MKALKKWVSLITALALVLTLLPMGISLAASDNAVDRVLSVSSTYKGSLGTITIQEKSDYKNDFKDGDTFRLILPSPVKWLTGATETVVEFNGSSTDVSVQKVSDQTIEITLNPSTSINNNNNVDKITIKPYVDVNGYTGDITVKIDPLDSAVSGETILIARASGGKAIVVAESVATIGETGTGGKIRIDEVAIGSLGTAQTFTLKLPPNFVWDGMSATDITFAGGFSGASVNNPPGLTGNNTRTLTFAVTLPPTPRQMRGSIYITPKIKAESGASFGEITVTVSSTDISSTDVVVAKYADWGIKVEVSEVKELVAGKLTDQVTGTIKIKEDIANSLINGRRLKVELPDWVKILEVKNWDATGDLSGMASTRPNVDGTKSSFDVVINRSGANQKSTIEFKLELSVEANHSGDIKAVISSAGAGTVETVIAKAIAPVTVEAGKAADVKIGVQGQDAPDLIIKENVKSAIKQRYNYVDGTVTPPDIKEADGGEITVSLPNGVYFAGTPTVQVVEGDLEIKADQVKVVALTGVNDKRLVIPVKSESTKPSTIKISNIKLTLDRTVPEGDLKVGVGGTAVVENYGEPGKLLKGQFVTDAIKAKLANTVTPAPQEMVRSAIFKIDSMKYIVDGQEKAMDVAPFIKDNRTFVPV
ncbi:MAG: copper amine oxidase N-terminal domain-containing protein, partial [Hydrogenibacillus schlegelii]|nr:copper amine oxidase N-terminal domain-containing protein [Hydrogenibacillus schlegelii]